LKCSITSNDDADRGLMGSEMANTDIAQSSLETITVSPGSKGGSNAVSSKPLNIDLSQVRWGNDEVIALL